VKTALAFAVCAVACKRGGGSVDGAAVGHTFTYDFNGSAYSGSLLARADLSTSAGIELGLEATDASDDVLLVAAFAQAELTIGTYTVGNRVPAAGFAFTAGSNGTWTDNNIGPGSVVITSLTATEVTGTFSATLFGSGSSQGSALLTNGVFDLQVDDVPSPGSGA
jgi:hypothetical protein